MWIWLDIVFLLLVIIGMTIDITAFFILIRLLSKRRYSPLLQAFDQAGSLLVDGLMQRMPTWLTKLGRSAPASEPARMCMALICLILLRFAIAALLTGLAAVRI